MTEMEKKALREGTAQLVKWFIDAGVMLWVCSILLAVNPAFACLAGLTYWDWVGILWGMRVVVHYIRAIIHK